MSLWLNRKGVTLLKLSYEKGRVNGMLGMGKNGCDLDFSGKTRD